jgi:hypothetical protein
MFYFQKLASIYTLDLDTERTEMRVLKGEITCSETSRIEEGACAEIDVYCLRPQGPSVTIGKSRMENPRQFPINYEVLWDDTSLLNRSAKCMICVRITRNDRLDFLSKTDLPLCDKHGFVQDSIDVSVIIVHKR